MKSLFRVLFVACLLPLVARAQDFWQPFPQDVTTANLWSIAYDAGTRTLVAVGEQGTILTYSHDDSAWLARDSGLRSWLVGVGYGAGRLVVVGEGGTILTSDDAGVTWTPRSSGTIVRLNAAAYGGGRWLVVGEAGTVLTSPDGTTWTQRPALGPNFLRGLAYGQGRFVIGGGRGTLYTTTDAATFTPVPISTTSDIEAVAISPTRFWVSGSNRLLGSGTTLGAWVLTEFANHPTVYRGLALRNTEEASAIGNNRAAQTWIRDNWRSTFGQHDILPTAATQGRNEIVAVGFGGAVLRSSQASPVLVTTNRGRYLPYGGELRLRVQTGETATRYQWTREGIDLPGATQPELVLRNFKPADLRPYAVKLTLSTSGAVTAPFDPHFPPLAVIPAGRPDVRDPGFNPATLPSVVTPQPDGRLIVAGGLTTLPDGTTRGLVRLNSDGTLDSSFIGLSLPGTQSIEAITVLANGRIHVSGSFTSVSGQPRFRQARLLPDGTVDPTFVPDASVVPSKIVPLSDGRVYVMGQLSGAKVLHRLAADGAKDPTFPTLQNEELVNADPQGRLYTIARVGAATLLVRYRAEGGRDTSYTDTPVSFIPGLSETLRTTLITERGLYFATFGQGRFGSLFSFGRIKPDGGMDESYRSPPASTYPLINGRQWYRYFPDGSLVQTRSADYFASGNTVNFYDANGNPDRTRYALLPDLGYYNILGTPPDGSLIVRLTTDFQSLTESLVRIRPLSGRVGRLSNLSVRSFVDPSVDPLILGLVTLGNGNTRAIIRAVGPSLANYQVTDALADPRLSLTREGSEIAANDQWPAALGPRFPAVGAFPLEAGSRDAALESDIGSGSYTAIVTPAPGSAPGTALAELYESADDPATPRRFINASARGPVAAERPLIVGFGVTGDVPITVLIRCAGPSLTKHGVTGVLANPSLTLHRSGDGATLWESDDWYPSSSADGAIIQDAFRRTGAFAFDSTESKDAAMLVTLPPGTYSAVATGMGGTSGTALVEVYEVP